MVFLTPIILFGLLAAAIPIGIHLIRKEKPPKLMFGTIRFLKKTSKKLILFQQIQQWFLLLLRAGLIALLVFAFARPLINQSMARILDADPTSIVLLFDNSLSMRYADKFENAKQSALDILNDLDPGDEAALVLFSNSVESSQELTTDIDSLRLTLNNLNEPGYGGTNYMPNLRLADQLLTESRFDNRVVYLISDFQDIGFDETEADWNLAPGVAFAGIDVGEEESSNLVLTEVRSPEQLLEGSEEQTILARVRSSGSVYVSEAEVTLTIDGTVVDTQRVDLAEASEAVANLTANFDTSGLHRGQVTVNGDNFRADNNYYFTVDVAPKIKVLVVNGEASENWYDDEGHWFGLAVSSAVISPFELTTVESSRLDPALLREQDVAVLLNVGNLSPTQASAITDYVTTGGSLLIAPGDRVDAQQFNQQFAAISPASLQGSSEPFLDDYQVIADFDRRHPILRPLTNDWTARFQRHWQLQPHEDSDVLMQFDNTLPALVERNVGEGKVILFASTMDLEWNNLALQGMYLPFVHETLRHLVQEQVNQSAYRIGDIISLDDSQELEITAPDGTVSTGSPTQPLMARMPGFIEAVGTDSTRVFAVNVLAEESNLLKTTPATINDAIINPETSPIQSREVRTAQMAAELEQPQRVWWWILGLVIVLILVEARIANKTYR